MWSRVVCDVTCEWVSYNSVRLWCAIAVNAMCIPIHIHSKSHSYPIAPCKQNTLNRTKNILKNAVAFRKNCTVWTSLKTSMRCVYLIQVIKNSIGEIHYDFTTKCRRHQKSKIGESVTKGLMFSMVSQPRKQIVENQVFVFWTSQVLVSSDQPIRIVFLAWLSSTVYYWWIFLQVLANEAFIHMIYVIRHRYQLDA